MLLALGKDATGALLVPLRTVYPKRNRPFCFHPKASQPDEEVDTGTQ